MTQAQIRAANSFPVLMPGDALLYGGENLTDRLIQFRTWSDVAHIEIYVDAGRSVASRNGIGVGCYPFRALGLRYVLRPMHPKFDVARGMNWFEHVNGTPYGWGDLGRFYGLRFKTHGLICSEFADRFYQAARLPVFNPDYFAGTVCPRDFLTVSPLLLRQVWAYESHD